MPQYPNPDERDKNGALVYPTHEALMIAYQKQYGIAEAVRRINIFMQQQKQIIDDANRKQNEIYE